MKNIIFITVIIIITIIFSPAFAGAQAGADQTIIISPPTTSYMLNPGEQKEGTVKIRNKSSQSVTFSLQIFDFIVEDSKGTPHFLPSTTLNNRFSASSWITGSPPTFALEPDQVQEVRYIIKTPLDAGPGGHYSALLFSQKELTPVTSSRTAVETNIGSLLLITIPGPIREEAKITKFLSNSFQEYGPVKVFLSIQNNGDLHLRPTGKFTMFDIFGRTVAVQPLTETNIFPETSRDYEATFESKILLGRFKIDLNASYGNTNLLLFTSMYVWIIPWQILLLLTLSLITLILSMMYVKRRRTKVSEQAVLSS